MKIRFPIGVTFVLFFPVLALARLTWDPVPAADLAATISPTGADIEILSLTETLDSEYGAGWVQDIAEAKVYTKKGVDDVSILHVTYLKREKIWDVGARVLKPDGTIIELTKNDFIESNAVKKTDLDIRQTSFAFRGLSPGDVVQYQWKRGQSLSKWSFTYQWFYCQQEVPVRLYELHVLKTAADLQVLPFNCPNREVKSAGHSELMVRLRDLPAFVKEPDMPPERDFRSWICLLFTSKFMRLYSSEDAWTAIGGEVAEEFRLETGPNEAIRKKAHELTDAIPSPEGKLARLNAYCQSDYTNFDWVKSAETMDARKKREERTDHQGSGETFKKQTGNSEDIDRLFASLARALKFEVRAVRSTSRDDFSEMHSAKSYIFLNRTGVAVKVGDAWKFYMPSQYLSPPGFLSTKDEDVTMFVCDEDKSWFQKAPIAPATETNITRTGKFTLDGEGSLEGDVEVELTGHAAVEAKESWWGEPLEDAIKSLQENVTDRISGAEITDFKIINLGSLAMPVKFTYHVKASGYAESTGTRLVLTPDFFEIGKSPRFTGDSRKYPIMFDYASTSHDEVTITLPEGYTLDAPSAPRNVGKPTDIINAQYTVAFRPKARSLTYRRTQIIGIDGSIRFGKESFPTMKMLFEAMDRSNRHSFILKPVEAVAAAPAAVSPSAPKAPAQK